MKMEVTVVVNAIVDVPNLDAIEAAEAIRNAGAIIDVIIPGYVLERPKWTWGGIVRVSSSLAYQPKLKVN